jgi:hypothetical protein
MMADGVNYLTGMIWTDMYYELSRYRIRLTRLDLSISMVAENTLRFVSLSLGRRCVSPFQELFTCQRLR